jgi:hypothetical protein
MTEPADCANSSLGSAVPILSGIGAAGLLAALAVFLYLPGVDADMILMSIISVQKPSVFFWGQDRFALLLPWLLSPVKSPDANLLLLIWLHALSFFLMLLVLSQIAARLLGRSDFRASALAFLFPCAVAAAAMSPSVFAYVIAGPQPYPSSYLLLACATLLFFSERLPRIMAVAGATALLAAGMGVNPSIILMAAIVASGAFVFGRRRDAVAFLLIAAALFVVWYAVSLDYPRAAVSYYDFSLHGMRTNLARAWTTIAGDLRLPVAGMLLLTALILPLLLRTTGRWRFWLGIAAAVAIALGWTGFVSQAAWVATNDFNSRYFSTSYFAAFVAIGAVLAAAALHLPPRWQTRTCLALAGVTIALIARPVILPAAAPAVALVAPYEAHAREHRIKYVAGYFWTAWPTVFRLLDTPDAAFGLAFRALGNRDAVIASVKSDIAAARPVEALCLDAPADECIAQAGEMTGLVWRPAGQTCPGNCSVIAATGKAG